MNNTFTLLPMSQRFLLMPGKVTEGSIKIVNPADATEDFSYKVTVTPYGVVGEDYKADLETDSTRTAIAKWIEIEEPTGKIKPNESKEVKFKINVPANAPVGGQYATIAVSSNADTSSSSGVAVQNVLEMASVIYGTVNGPIEHKGEILENNVPGFIVSPPATLSALIKNEGNIHEDASFTIKVTDFFSGNTILPTENDDGEYSELIMPETTRYIEREVGNLPALGVVKVVQTINYMGKEPSTTDKVIIICPIWFMALVAATTLAIIFTIVQIIRKHRKHKKSDLAI
ncbi:hypothetical protein IKF04_01875 [Candidatus Saccharibacteria bacterium]|nr:hypothetical protein [Candidatus Saccharibacteria bacterium]